MDMLHPLPPGIGQGGSEVTEVTLGQSLKETPLKVAQVQCQKFA